MRQTSGSAGRREKSPSGTGPAIEGRRIAIRGTVQGVGMRPFVYRLARDLGLGGRVRNEAMGVTVEVFGPRSSLERFADLLVSRRPSAAAFDEIRVLAIEPELAKGFVIEESARGAPGAAELEVSIPSDLATCDPCLAEIRDPRDRRHRYPFTNCTDCGPRFTIARSVPYDRPATTMAPFLMCAECRREYDDPGDRRFHAQPNACPRCGPLLRLLRGDGSLLECPDPLAAAASKLVEGGIVAVKGIGGFHLACDATSGTAVSRLRAGKRRDEKPFAVMVRDLAEAESLAHLTDPERRLLDSVERPIVLCRRRAGTAIAPEVAPGNPLVGLILPYAPLHHLLLEMAARPLVMTSGNVSEEPIAFRDGEAVERLGTLCDALLVHDREIEARADDSVARVVAGAPVVMRRSRGYVPRGIRIGRPFARPVLACGAHLKNTFCIGRRDVAVLGPHVGDLENLDVYESFQASIERMERFLDVNPEVIAHDLHPGYLSTLYALERAASRGALAVGVQHHHAHAVACMAEHGLEGPAIAVAYDGTGYGGDGTSWGGEVLLVEHHRFERLAAIRPVALAGSDRAVAEPWRVALALVLDAFGGAAPLERLDLFSKVPEREVRVVRRMIEKRLNSPLAHGAGRLFDAVAALVLSRPRSRFEGQLALALDGVASEGDSPPYPYAIDASSTPVSIDLRPMTLALVEEILAGRPAAALSARFHETLVRATADAVRAVAPCAGRLPVVLTGGCFQNARLAEGLVASLGAAFDVYLHRRVPPGDGGIALGQALVADAVARG